MCLLISNLFYEKLSRDDWKKFLDVSLANEFFNVFLNIDFHKNYISLEILLELLWS